MKSCDPIQGAVAAAATPLFPPGIPGGNARQSPRALAACAGAC